MRLKAGISAAPPSRPDENAAAQYYDRVVRQRGRTRLFQCGYQDRFDPFFLSQQPHLRTLYSHLLRQSLGGVPCSRVLDIGCGTGLYFDLLGQYAHWIEALDCSQEMIGVARKFCEQQGLDRINLTVGFAESLPWPDGQFDAVLAFDALHHVTNLDEALREVRRVLKPGGRFAVFEPNVLNPLMWLAHRIPAEERQALSRSRPQALVHTLESHFDSAHWEGVCALITHPPAWIRGALDAYLYLCRCVLSERRYPRQLWVGTRRETV